MRDSAWPIPSRRRSLANALHQVRGEACDLVAQALGGDGGHLLRDLLVDPMVALRVAPGWPWGGKFSSAADSFFPCLKVMM